MAHALALARAGPMARPYRGRAASPAMPGVADARRACARGKVWTRARARARGLAGAFTRARCFRGGRSLGGAAGVRAHLSCRRGDAQAGHLSRDSGTARHGGRCSGRMGRPLRGAVVVTGVSAGEVCRYVYLHLGVNVKRLFRSGAGPYNHGVKRRGRRGDCK